MSRKARKKLNLELEQIIAEFLETGGEESPRSPLARILVPFFRRLADCDYERSICVFQGWRRWLQNSTAKTVEELKTIDEYLSHRRFDIGLE